jgi:hypothetical protein
MMLKRHTELGLPGICDASRTPKSHPNQTPPEQEAAILRVGKAHSPAPSDCRSTC